MTTTRSHHPGHTPAWLTEAATQLEARGEYQLAAEARTEAADYWTPEPVQPATIICDGCGRKVTSVKRIADYAALDVDWVMCAKCTREVLADLKPS